VYLNSLVIGLIFLAALSVSIAIIAYLIRSRSQARQAVKNLMEMTEFVLDAVPVPIYLRDTEGRLIITNKAHCNLTGRTREEVIGKTVFDLYQPHEAEKFDAFDRKVLEGKTDGEIVENQVFSDFSGKIHELVTTKGIYRTRDGKTAGVIGVSIDITEQKALEEKLRQACIRAEEANRAKSAFLSTMSHEIRTPMNGVIGMTELLRETVLDAEQKECVSIIQSSGELLLSLINDILDFSKIESGALELDNCSTALPELIQSTMGVFAMRAATLGIELLVSIEPEVPHTIWVDPLRLRQILTNLLGNALKFTEKGEIVVHVSCKSPAGFNRRLHFEVRDTGIGIPPDKQKDIFKSFVQVDASTTRKYGGSGLGLAISKRLCEIMGGRIWVESILGKGSTFHFTINTKSKAATTNIVKSIRSELHGRTVLLVDDNETNRLLLQASLERQGALVESFEHSPAALSRLLEKNPPPDVAILDMQMPEMDGCAMAECIRAHPPLKHLPLMLLSSIMVRPPKDLFDAVITKPAIPNQIIETLRGMLKPNLPQPDLDRIKTLTDRLPQPSPLLVLVVEDNAVNQKVMLLNLAKLGYRADLAVDGVEAIEKMEKMKYDLVFMDIQMPGMDGIEVTRIIRERGLCPGVQIVALTADVEKDVRKRALDAGMNDFLAKPFIISELRNVLNQIQHTS